MASCRLGMACAAVAAACVHAGPPPETLEQPVTDRMHDTEIVDPYRWLEGDLSDADPNRFGRPTPEVDAWTTAQNAHTRSVLDGLPGREALTERITRLVDVPSVGLPGVGGQRVFFSRRVTGQNQSTVVVRERRRDGTFGEPRVLVDPNAIDPTGLTAVSWTSPSPGGELLAFGLYRAGDENATLHVIDASSGEWLADEIPGKVSFVRWLSDGRRFVYSRLADMDDPYSREFREHRVGSHWSRDPVLARQPDVSWFFAGRGYDATRLASLRTTWGPFLTPSEDGRWAVVGYYTGTDSADLWAADLDAWRRTGRLRLVEMASEQPGRPGAMRFVGDRVFMSTQVGAPRGRVVAASMHDPSMRRWAEVVPEDAEAVIEDVSFTRGFIVVTQLVRAMSRVRVYEYSGRLVGDLPLPTSIGSATVSADDRSNEIFLRFESYNTPPTIFRLDLAATMAAAAVELPEKVAARYEVWHRPEVPVDPSSIDVKQVTYRSKDGTEVTMFIVHRGDLGAAEPHATMLYGYGGFNVSMTPSFSASLYAWLADGGVLAIPNLRGGGEYGAEWHRAGQLDRKQNVFDDFIAAAEHLIDLGVTTPDQLVIYGGSNGGLLTGAAVTQRPDLFAGAISAVPLLDMLRYERFLMARFWVPEYGDPSNPRHFEFLRAYSPYHNIREGERYPAVLFTAGENDTRVHPMHARKMAARMQAATASSPAQRPVLLWVDRDSGHGGGKPLNLRIRDTVDIQMFARWQSGLLAPG